MSDLAIIHVQEAMEVKYSRSAASPVLSSYPQHQAPLSIPRSSQIAGSIGDEQTVTTHGTTPRFRGMWLDHNIHIPISSSPAPSSEVCFESNADDDSESQHAASDEETGDISKLSQSFSLHVKTAMEAVSQSVASNSPEDQPISEVNIRELFDDDLDDSEFSDMYCTNVTVNSSAVDGGENGEASARAQVFQNSTERSPQPLYSAEVHIASSLSRQQPSGIHLITSDYNTEACQPLHKASNQAGAPQLNLWEMSSSNYQPAVKDPDSHHDRNEHGELLQKTQSEGKESWSQPTEQHTGSCVADQLSASQSRARAHQYAVPNDQEEQMSSNLYDPIFSLSSLGRTNSNVLTSLHKWRSTLESDAIENPIPANSVYGEEMDVDEPQSVSMDESPVGTEQSILLPNNQLDMIGTRDVSSALEEPQGYLAPGWKSIPDDARNGQVQEPASRMVESSSPLPPPERLTPTRAYNPSSPLPPPEELTPHKGHKHPSVSRPCDPHSVIESLESVVNAQWMRESTPAYDDRSFSPSPVSNNGNQQLSAIHQDFARHIQVAGCHPADYQPTRLYPAASSGKALFSTSPARSLHVNLSRSPSPPILERSSDNTERSDVAQSEHSIVMIPAPPPTPTDAVPLKLPKRAERRKSCIENKKVRATQSRSVTAGNASSGVKKAQGQKTRDRKVTQARQRAVTGVLDHTETVPQGVRRSARLRQKTPEC